MCGIAASFAYSPDAPRINPACLAASIAKMASRGPDGTGSWTSKDGRTGMSHCRLSIIDLSGNAAQPMCTQDGSLVVVFNGEIYNYLPLRSELQAKGYQFRTQSDTEVLLHLYAESGPAMVHRLQGMFAFAIWDQSKKGIFLARDAYGIKPLYFADDGKTFRIASQVKALLATGEVGTTPEPAGHVGFFLWGNVPEPYTLFKSIRSLPSGSSLWLDSAGRKEFRTFFSLREVLKDAQGPESAVNSRDRQQLITSALGDSLRKHLVADVPVGIFLSSGLDSACLLALAARERSHLKTVTLGFEEYRGTSNDETTLAEQLARKFGADHQTVWVSKSDFEWHFEKMLAAMDQPSIDGVNTYFVSFAAAQASLKVALSGIGGDELFGGYPSFCGVPRLAAILRSFGPCKLLGRSLRKLSSPLLSHITSPKYAGLLEYGTTLGGAYLLRRGMHMPWEMMQLMDRDFVNQGLNELNTIQRLNESVSGLRSSHLKLCALESGWYMQNQLLRDADWASMAHSLELRVPLVDSELLRTMAPLMSGEHAPGKREMALATDGALPEAFLKRPKTGFTIPVREWITPTNAGRISQRGLRGWSRLVYSRFANSKDFTPPLAEPKTLESEFMEAAAL